MSANVRGGGGLTHTVHVTAYITRVMVYTVVHMKQETEMK